MARDLILGTAGHIDHGKTALVKALTGIDCDRLPEEKRRGITIDLGFANLTLGDCHLGVVDVPGHEKFVKNMLAGATGLDVALLVVAADDGVMPQTREHLAILTLLGVRQGVIALTKADLVGEEERELAALEVRELVGGTFLEAAPLVATSTVTNAGVAELRDALQSACERLPPRPEVDWFRLAIDRAFVVQGHGTVVTGTVASGSVRVGDGLEWHRENGPADLVVHVRGLNRHNRPAEVLHRGQRAAINLAGVSHDEVRRGQEMATAGCLLPSRVLTVRLHCLPDAGRPIKHRLPVRLHIGTADLAATVSVLNADRVAPGEWAFAQLFLAEHAAAVWGQPFVVRDSSAEHTLGGGQVLQPVAAKLRRRHVASLEGVERLWTDDRLARSAAVGWCFGFTPFRAVDLIPAAGLGRAEADTIAERLEAAGTFVNLPVAADRPTYLHRERTDELGEMILDALAKLHAEQPLLTTHDRQKVLARLDFVRHQGPLRIATERLLAAGKLVGDAKRIARADFKPKLSANQRKLKDRIVEDLRRAAFAPPDAASFANLAGGNAAALPDIYEVAVAEGHVVKIAADLYLHADAEARMRLLVTDRLQTAAGLTVAEIRDLLGTTRKYAVPLCEYLDRTGVTRRQGDRRVSAS